MTISKDTSVYFTGTARDYVVHWNTNVTMMT